MQGLWHTSLSPKTCLGFQKGRSTMHCIMAIVEEVLCLTRTKRSSHEVAVVFLDLEKAFELVDHPVVVVRSLVKKGLLGKLLQFMAGYLEIRSARVTFQGESSQYLPLHNGVPQGGVLRTLLFNTVVEQLLELHISDTTVYSMRIP